MSVTCYPGTKHKDRHICANFAKGAGGEVQHLPELKPGPAAFYGLGPHNRRIFDRVRDDWYYIDNGYFSSTFTDAKDPYFRVTKNAFQHSGMGRGDQKRFAVHNITIRPWQKNGKHILVCPPREYWAKWTVGMDHEVWLQETLAEIKSHTDRPIRIRYKPSVIKRPDNTVKLREGATVPLYQDLKKCHALVTFRSNVAVEAILHGIPVFCDAGSSAWPMSGGDLGRIDDPAYPDGRLEWASVLAANQWTIGEMASGQCWREVNG